MHMRTHVRPEQRSYPPSFNPANIMEEVKTRIKAKAALEKAFPMLKEEKPK